jgi:urease accessory protein
MPRPRPLSAAVLLVLAPSLAPPAHAHLMSTGFGPFYDGLSHLFVTPEDLLQVIGVALLAGLGGASSARAALFALPAAWLAGSLVGTLVGAHATAVAPAAVVTLTLGGLIAADAPLPPWTIAGITVAIGVLAGAQNGAELAAAHASTLVAAGAACALFVTLSLLGGQVVSVRAPWARVVVRVGGSWIAAIGLLMLGWSLRAA